MGINQKGGSEFESLHDSQVFASNVHSPSFKIASQDIATIAWAYATLEIPDESLFRVLTSRATVTIESKFLRECSVS